MARWHLLSFTPVSIKDITIKWSPLSNFLWLHFKWHLAFIWDGAWMLILAFIFDCCTTLWYSAPLWLVLNFNINYSAYTVYQHCDNYFLYSKSIIFPNYPNSWHCCTYWGIRVNLSLLLCGLKNHVFTLPVGQFVTSQWWWLCLPAGPLLLADDQDKQTGRASSWWLARCMPLKWQNNNTWARGSETICIHLSLIAISWKIHNNWRALPV